MWSSWCSFVVPDSSLGTFYNRGISLGIAHRNGYEPVKRLKVIFDENPGLFDENPKVVVGLEHRVGISGVKITRRNVPNPVHMQPLQDFDVVRFASVALSLSVYVCFRV